MAGLFDFFGLDELARRMAEMGLEPEHVQQAIQPQSPHMGGLLDPMPPTAQQGQAGEFLKKSFNQVGPDMNSFFGGIINSLGQTQPTAQAGQAGQAIRDMIGGVSGGDKQAETRNTTQEASERIRLSGLGELMHPNVDKMVGADRPHIIAPNVLPAASVSGVPQAQMVRPEGPAGMGGAEMLAPPQAPPASPILARPSVVAPNTMQPTPQPLIQPPPLNPQAGIQSPQVRSTQTTPVATRPNNRAGELETRGIPGNIRAIVSAAAQKYGQDPNTALRVAYIESRGNPNAKNKSGASGLFQFMPGTAEDYGLQNPFDAEANADAAMRLMRDNRNYLTQKLGREPTPGELYLAHQQGAGGAEKLLANPDASAAKLLGSKAVTQNGGTEDMTAKQFADMWTSRIDNFGDVPADAPDTMTATSDAGAPVNPGESVQPDGAPADVGPAQSTFASRLGELGKAIKAPPPSDRGKPPSGTAPLPQASGLNPNPEAIQLIMSMLGGAGGQIPQVSPTLGQLLGARR